MDPALAPGVLAAECTCGIAPSPVARFLARGVHPGVQDVLVIGMVYRIKRLPDTGFQKDSREATPSPRIRDEYIQFHVLAQEAGKDSYAE